MRLRGGLTRQVPALVIRIAGPANADPVAIAREKGSDTYAVLSGPLATPRIVEREPDSNAGRYLALLADDVLRSKAAGPLPPVAPRFESLSSGGTSIALQQSLGFGAVFIIFLLTLLLAGQTVSSLAEEKGNKVIEILAAAVPLESVFLGKGISMPFVMASTALKSDGVAVSFSASSSGSRQASTISSAVNRLPFAIFV